MIEPDTDQWSRNEPETEARTGRVQDVQSVQQISGKCFDVV